MRSAFFAPDRPRILAHRGLARDAPENTLLSFAHAIAAGASYVETDVHGSADGVAMISHDPDLARMVGRKVGVQQLTSHELRRIQLGQGQAYCSLADALDAFPDTRFNIDIKSASAIPGTIAAIRDLGATERVLIGSFSSARRRAVVRELPGVATSASSREIAGTVLAARSAGGRSAVRRALQAVDAVQIPVTAGRLRVITRRSVAAYHDAGVEVHVWTINDAVQMNDLLDLGVDGLVSDRAEIALDVVATRAS